MEKGKVNFAIEVYLTMKASTTRRAYSGAMKDFATFLGANFKSEAFEKKLRAAKPAHALEYMAWVRARIAPDGTPIAPATVKARFAALHSICEQLTRLEILNKNPFAAIRGAISWRQAHQKRPTKLLTTEDVQKMLEMPDLRSKSGVRDAALLSILFGGGLRRSEALGLNVGDVQVSQSGHLFLKLSNTKGGADQEQSLPGWAAEKFSLLVSQRKTEGAKNNDALFVFYYENEKPRDRLCERSIARIYHSYAAAAGTDAAPHSARATSATILKSMGYEDRDVQSFLRHKTSKMVATYDKRARGVDQNIGLKLPDLTKNRLN